MEIGLTLVMMLGTLLMGFITGFIINIEGSPKPEDLEKEYETGHRFGYNDALDDVEIDFEIDLKEYRDTPYTRY